MTPEEALKKVREAAVEGTIQFAPDTLTAAYDAEIQEIFEALYWEAYGKVSPRGLWTADGQSLSVVLPRGEAMLSALDRAGKALGLTLAPDTLWEDAGATLRALRGGCRD